jgi:UDP-N-acetylmuramate dehydrogenase
VKPGTLSTEQVEALRDAFGGDLREREALARYTSARIGGPADFLLRVSSADSLRGAVERLWTLGLTFRLLGGGSNVLVSDRGVRGVVILNQARAVRFMESPQGLRVWAESGASLGSVARRTVERGWAGLEWAATVPGTIGGAVVGNAGAHGSDMRECLEVAEILQRGAGVEAWPAERLEFAYRDSWLKRNPGQAVVLSVTLRAQQSTPETAKATMQEYVQARQETQPGGASMGSMFKNPPDDYAGRLIEAAGLKGLRVGDAEISPQHANFFINHGAATAAQVRALVEQAQREVAARFGVELELEVELIGEWNSSRANAEEQSQGELT